MTEYAVRSWDDVPFDPRPSYVLLDSFEDYVDTEMESSLSDVRQWLRTATGYFPELAGENIYVAITHEEITYHGEPHAMADPYNRLIYLNRGCIAEGYQTLFHELTHLVIYKEADNGEDVPKTSEPYCSIRAVAKMDGDLLYRDDIAYLGTPSVPKDKWPGICKRALVYREEHRNYIQQCKEWLQINE